MSQDSNRNDLDQHHGNMNEVITKLPIAHASRTNLLDLNDDCLLSILSRNFSVMDLCSVAETNSRLKQIASRIFSRTLKKHTPEILLATDAGTRILSNFGSVITCISIGALVDIKTSTNLLHLIAKYCSNTLKSLSLYKCVIDQDLAVKLSPLFNNLELLHLQGCSFNGVCGELFANCESLIELAVFGGDTGYMRFLFSNSFPKLQRFISSIYSIADYHLESFIPRHPNLKFVECSSYQCSYLLPIIANNCLQLEELEIGLKMFNAGLESGTMEEAFKIILRLNHLRKLIIHCNGRNATLITKELSCNSSLESLKLKDVLGDSEFIPAVSQLKGLRSLQLAGWGFQDLNPLGTLDQLTDLSILVIGKVDLDLVQMVKRLNNLKTLNLKLKTFKIDEAMYLRIVDVVQGREVGYQRTLELTCYTVDGAIENLQSNGYNLNHSIVKLIDNTRG